MELCELVTELPAAMFRLYNAPTNIGFANSKLIKDASNAVEVVAEEKRNQRLTVATPG